jgi:molybdenum cofactor cytidylyltransferase
MNVPFLPTGVVLAAGLSRRMGAHKPLLPLGERTVLATAIGALVDGGVGDVVVVTGYRAEAVEAEARACGARVEHNPRYEDGMYSSVQAGVRALPGDAPAFLLLPCDIPAVGAATVHMMIGAWRDSGEPDVCFPVHGNRRGHPPVISAALAPDIVATEPTGGLRQLLADRRALHIPTPSAGILRDIDTPGRYEVLVARPPRRVEPSPARAEAMLDEAERGPARRRAREAMRQAEIEVLRGQLVQVEELYVAALLSAAT